MTKTTIKRIGMVSLAAAALTACGGSDNDSTDVACAETGQYACKTGSTEPLYTFQWALNHKDSFFAAYPDVSAGGLDLNVEPVHRQGIKGQGVKVMVLDSGADLHNEDLLPNAAWERSWNFLTNTNDPYPVKLDHRTAPHGTAVAGIIGAAQNGKGVMGVAPQASIAAANLLEGQLEVSAYFVAYGSSEWSSQTDIFNASYGQDEVVQPYEAGAAELAALQGLKNLRGGKGAIFVKAAGNAFDGPECGMTRPQYFDCSNPANDPNTLEPHVVTVAALNARGSASTYSSAGPVVWITGMGGEFGGGGNYGETVGARGNDGPTIYSTDIRGCIEGYSYTGGRTPFMRGQTVRGEIPDNPNCDYTYMNGTSSAAPTITGVVALMLSANPDLTWRDVRDILRLSARKVDHDYIRNMPFAADKAYGSLFDLTTNEPVDQLGSAEDIRDGATRFPMNLGWQKNGAGLEYSDWYGFGVPDAERAVALSKEYASNRSLSRGSDVVVPEFQPISYWYNGVEAMPEGLGDVPKREGPFPYQRVTSIGKLTADDSVVDQFQVRLTGANVCLGSLGIAVKSPSGTVSILKMPNDHFKADGWDSFEDYGLGSYAFYGESAKGDWEIFAIASNPAVEAEVGVEVDGHYELDVSSPCPSADNESPLAFAFATEARIISQ